jgi:hypothetical protein
MANPFPFVAGDVLTAAELNGIGEAWTTFNPTITQGVTPTKTVLYSKYAQVNKIVIWQGYFQFTSAGTASSIITSNFPVTPLTTGTFNSVGSAMLYQTATNRSYLLTATINAGELRFWYDNQLNFMGAAPAVTIANNTYLGFTITYEVA